MSAQHVCESGIKLHVDSQNDRMVEKGHTNRLHCTCRSMYFVSTHHAHMF